MKPGEHFSRQKGEQNNILEDEEGKPLNVVLNGKHFLMMERRRVCSKVNFRDCKFE